MYLVFAFWLEREKFCQIGATLVQNCGDSEIGRIVIRAAKEKKYKTISIIDGNPGTPDIIEELKALGGDIVLPESYTKTWVFVFSQPRVTIVHLFLMINFDNTFPFYSNSRKF